MGYGKHGLGLEALKAFDKMVLEGVVPNQVTFVGTLYASNPRRIDKLQHHDPNILLHAYNGALHMHGRSIRASWPAC